MLQGTSTLRTFYPVTRILPTRSAAQLQLFVKRTIPRPTVTQPDRIKTNTRFQHIMATNGNRADMAVNGSPSTVRKYSVSNEEWQHRTQLAKKLIVCCDGTWMNSDNGWVPGKGGKPGHLQTPTNVTRIARAISSEDDGHHPQIVYYQAGIGTGIGLYNHLVGGVSGLGLSENVREAYSFLASNYSPQGPLVASDSIFLLGFSRGAYTARSLGGFICALGILKKPAMQHFYEIYMDWENAGEKNYKPVFFDSYFEHIHDIKKVKPDDALARDEKRRDEYLRTYFEYLLELNLTQEVDIKCIGVWDTVGSLGIPVNPVLQRVMPFLPSFIREAKWFDTRLDNHVKNAYQALALDEHRFPYSPAVWELDEHSTTNMKQVWFPGAHSNVGGSYADTGTADITLAWMMDQLAGHTRPKNTPFQTHDWIKFDMPYVIATATTGAAEYARATKPPEYQGWARGKIYSSCTFPQSLAGSRTRTPGRTHRTFYDSGDTDPNHVLLRTHEYVHASVRARIDLGGRACEPDEDTDKSVIKGMIGSVSSTLGKLVRAGKPELYAPQAKGMPLEGWRLEDGHKGHDRPGMGVSMEPPRKNSDTALATAIAAATATAAVTSVNGRPNSLAKSASSGEEADSSSPLRRRIRWVYEGTGMAGTKVMEEDSLGPFERQLLRQVGDAKVAEEVVWSNDGWAAPVEGPAMVAPRPGKTI